MNQFETISRTRPTVIFCQLLDIINFKSDKIDNFIPQ